MDLTSAGATASLSTQIVTVSSTPTTVALRCRGINVAVFSKRMTAVLVDSVTETAYQQAPGDPDVVTRQSAA